MHKRLRASCRPPPLCECLPLLFRKEAILRLMVWEGLQEWNSECLPGFVRPFFCPTCLAGRFCPEFVLAVLPDRLCHKRGPQSSRKILVESTINKGGVTVHARTHTHTHAHTQPHRHTDTQTHRRTQTHRHTDTQRHRDTQTQRGTRRTEYSDAGKSRDAPTHPRTRTLAPRGANSCRWLRRSSVV